MAALRLEVGGPVGVALGGEAEVVGERRLVHRPRVAAAPGLRRHVLDADPVTGRRHRPAGRRIVGDEQPVEHRGDAEPVAGEPGRRGGVLAVAPGVEHGAAVTALGGDGDGPVLRPVPQPLPHLRLVRDVVGVDVDRVAVALAA